MASQNLCCNVGGGPYHRAIEFAISRNHNSFGLLLNDYRYKFHDLIAKNNEESLTIGGF
jgi:hypothetical protein